MINICMKELKLYFKKPLAYVFIGVFFMATAFRFVENMILGNPDIQNLFSQFAGFLWVLIPILSAGLFAYEKENGTDRFLFTAPISSFGIVFGKYLAALIVYVKALILTFLFTLVFIMHTKPDFMVVLNAYFAMFMYGSAVLAIGLFFGSVMKDRLASITLSIGLLIFMNQIAMLKLIENLPKWLDKTVDFFAISSKYSAFFGSSVTPEAFVYFLSLAAIFILATVIAVENKSK